MKSHSLQTTESLALRASSLIRHSALALCLAAAITHTASARTIAWGSDVSSVMLDSTGTPMNDSFVFELGTFQAGFTPTASNMSDWVTNWKVFDRANAPGSNGWNSTFGWVSSSATVEADQTTSRTDLPQVVFAPGEQAYILAYNSLALTTPGTQVALLTDDSSDGNALDNWLIPTSDTHSPDTLDWRINSASTVIYGGINDTQGAGSFTAPNTSFTLESHTTPAAVPEPSGAMLILAAGTLLRMRRRK